MNYLIQLLLLLLKICNLEFTWSKFHRPIGTSLTVFNILSDSEPVEIKK